MLGASWKIMNWSYLLPSLNLLGQWLNFKLFGITYLVGKVKFKLFFQGPLAEWVKLTASNSSFVVGRWLPSFWGFGLFSWFNYPGKMLDSPRHPDITLLRRCVRSGRSTPMKFPYNLIGDGKNQPKSVGVYRAPWNKDSAIIRIPSLKVGRSPIPKKTRQPNDHGTCQRKAHKSHPNWFTFIYNSSSNLLLRGSVGSRSHSILLWESRPLPKFVGLMVWIPSPGHRIGSGKSRILRTYHPGPLGFDGNMGKKFPSDLSFSKKSWTKEMLGFSLEDRLQGADRPKSGPVIRNNSTGMSGWERSCGSRPGAESCFIGEGDLLDM